MLSCRWASCRTSTCCRWRACKARWRCVCLSKGAVLVAGSVVTQNSFFEATLGEGGRGVSRCAGIASPVRTCLRLCLAGGCAETLLLVCGS